MGQLCWRTVPRTLGRGRALRGAAERERLSYGRVILRHEQVRPPRAPHPAHARHTTTCACAAAVAVHSRSHLAQTNSSSGASVSAIATVVPETLGRVDNHLTSHCFAPGPVWQASSSCSESLRFGSWGTVLPHTRHSLTTPSNPGSSWCRWRMPPQNPWAVAGWCVPTPLSMQPRRCRPPIGLMCDSRRRRLCSEFVSAPPTACARRIRREHARAPDAGWGMCRVVPRGIPSGARGHERAVR